MNNNVKRKLGCFLLSFALAATVTDVFADISQAEITRRMDALERSINSMQKQMYNSMAEKTAVGSSKANSIDKTKDLLDEIRTMHAEIDKIEDRSKKLKNEFREFKTDVSKKISTIESASPKNINKISDDAYIINNLSKEIEFNTVEGASKVISTAASDTQKYEIPPEVAYQNAYITLKRKNTSGQVDYDKAQNDFETFIKQYPQSVLVGNAYYWIGQIYMQQKSYNKAAIEYLNGYKATPTSGRAMHNLIGLADALMQLGKTKEVCSTLNKLFNDFTDINSELKRNADKMYNDAGCNK